MTFCTGHFVTTDSFELRHWCSHTSACYVIDFIWVYSLKVWLPYLLSYICIFLYNNYSVSYTEITVCITKSFFRNWFEMLQALKQHSLDTIRVSLRVVLLSFHDIKGCGNVAPFHSMSCISDTFHTWIKTNET